MFEKMFEFDKPLTRRLYTKYNEALALLVLQYYNYDFFSGLIKDEAPDLQDINKGFGVEVVEAISQNTAKIDGVFTKRRLHPEKITKELCETTISQNGGFLDEYGVTYPVATNYSEKTIIQYDSGTVYH